VFRSIYISLLFLICIIPALGQVKVVDASRISDRNPAQFLPDVEGKVLIDEGYLTNLALNKPADAIPVFPGWPVSRPGTNERGGAYGNLDDDPELELIYPAGAALYAFNSDGSDVVGWPQPLDYPTDGAASFGDIDGDGIGEIVVTTHQIATFASGKIYAFEINGNIVTGFPVITEGGGVRTPVLADLDGDGALEIIIAVRNWPEGLVYAFHGDGTIFPGWPQRMDYVPGSDVAVGDITGDDIPEIVVESYYGLHAFTFDGFLMDGFPYMPGLSRVFSYSTPVLADIDGDGLREIICGDHSLENGTGAIHIVKNDGTSLDGWPKTTNSWIYGPPSVGDINGDGLLDIAVGDQTLSVSPTNRIYAWTAETGAPLPGFPIEDIFGVNSQIILADIDGDDQIELIFDDNTSDGKYSGYNHDGTIMEDWPLPVDGSTFFINPMVVDINLDGTMAISGGGYNDASGNINIYLWNAGVEYNSELAVLPILQYNTRHNGGYGDTFMVGMKERPGVIKGGWNIYPNPVREILNFKFSMLNSGKDLSLSIYDISGKEITTLKVLDYQKDLQLSTGDWEKGIYAAVLKDGHLVIASRKIVIIH
jgi:hypothetical protein